MIKDKRVIVVLPAYNAENTLEKTYREIPHDIVDDVILVDDASCDNTINVAKKLGIRYVIQHERNLGYGANQKTCYKKALEIGGDIIIMLHPDYQYTPKLITAMADIIASGVYPVVMGSRTLGKGARKGGMPLYKYISNRFLTLIQNLLIGQKLSEYHSGYRAYSREVLETIDYDSNSNDFVFDNEVLIQIFDAGFQIAEITCPTRYAEESSSINFRRSVQYGLGVLSGSLRYFLYRVGLLQNWRRNY